MPTETDTRTMHDYRPGDVLPNGATLIAHRPRGDGAVIILALYTGVSPYVTWVTNHSNPAATDQGHYFNTLAPAVADYERRR